VTDFRPAAVGAVVALGVGAFCFVAMETLPVGLLPLIAADFGRSLSGTGMLVTGYGLTVAITSVPLAYATRRIPRRRLIAVLLAVFAVATVASGLAGNFAILLGSRVVVALSQAVFWSVVGPAAASLFPLRVRGRATAIVFGGSALAPMLGVPAGTWVGQQMGWRWAFFGLAGFGLLAFAMVALLMPAAPAGQSHAATGTAPDARRYVVVLVITVLAVTGLFTAFTYTTPFLTDVAGFSPGAVGPLLLVRGVVGFGAIVLAGFLIDRNLRGAMVLAVVVMAASLLGTYAFGTSGVFAAIGVALSGFAHGVFSPAVQNMVMEVAPGNADLANAGDSAIFNVGIAGGALIGGLTLDSAGLLSTPLVGGIFAVAALAVVLSEPLLIRRPPHPRVDHELRVVVDGVSPPPSS
jgi:MFS transporter, DHA1 family, inner membrane transport protein